MHAQHENILVSGVLDNIWCGWGNFQHNLISLFNIILGLDKAILQLCLATQCNDSVWPVTYSNAYSALKYFSCPCIRWCLMWLMKFQHTVICLFNIILVLGTANLQSKLKPFISNGWRPVYHIKYLSIYLPVKGFYDWSDLYH